ncbi:ImmA/IrrE family metallo-endopeptidase [Streptomyces olivoreticuli]|uniref:ImmA/IrrE family metallo-endopeptidase n=1 Tax=Streptomyces olivoreticuli TaxID=68246 RepID=UPI002658DBFD|nr:ImmA/IrrE family metallo-endopeptidase [Streptomyces olivoreticuli]WKK26445.1 ImmA/IrrE family metallo-endopeptidase [Streptomyces olivoreticuli]
MSAYDPEDELGRLGIPVHYMQLRDMLAAWDAECRKVYCALGLSSVLQRCVLAHEVAHIALGHHRCTYGGAAAAVVTLAQERAAEVWAARKLITVVELAVARDSGLPDRAIAHELGVTERVYHARLLAEREDEQRWLTYM